MGFGSILDLFKQDNWSNKLVDKIGVMLELGSEMFDYTSGVVVNGLPVDDPQTNLYDRDQLINKMERKIRRRIVSHLSVQGSRAEVPSALIFMNAVKDAERIGDYVKNLFEVQAMMPEEADRQLYLKHLEEPTAIVAAMFAKCRKAFAESDEELAGQVIKKSKNSGKDCEAMIRDLTNSDLSTRDAVCLVLILRFYKRLMAHMSNIASTVVMPVDMIDFYDESDDPTDC